MLHEKFCPCCGASRLKDCISFRCGYIGEGYNRSENCIAREKKYLLREKRKKQADRIRKLRFDRHALLRQTNRLFLYIAELKQKIQDCMKILSQVQ